MLELFHPDMKRKERKPCTHKPLNRDLQVKTTPCVFLGTLGGFMPSFFYKSPFIKNTTSNATLQLSLFYLWTKSEQS